MEEVLRLHPNCIRCLLREIPYQYPDWASDDQKREYMQRVLEIIGTADRTTSPPEIVFHTDEILEEMFGISKDFSDVKYHFNEVMMAKKDAIRENIFSGEDPLKAAIQYATTGNYIDFGAMKDVNEDDLNRLLDASKERIVDEVELDHLREDICRGKKLTYIADNCGEIVLDMLVMEVIRQINPDMAISVIVRSGNMLNDANMDDAIQVGLDTFAPVMGNGSGVAGTCLNLISKEAMDEIDSADVLIAKGQANFETMRKCGRNIYYIFLCKCGHFEERFHVERLTGMLINDRRMENGED